MADWGIGMLALRGRLWSGADGGSVGEMVACCTRAGVTGLVVEPIESKSGVMSTCVLGPVVTGVVSEMTKVSIGLIR